MKRRRKNQVRKRGVFPRFIISVKGGTETIWKYREWTIEVDQRSQTEYAWKAYLDDWAHVRRVSHAPPCGDFRLFENQLTGPTGETEQDALWIAKYWIDRWELYWSTWHKDKDGACQLLRAIKMLESRAQRIGELKQKLTRGTLAREWQQLDPKQSGIPARGAIAWDYFQTLPLKRRTAIMDDVVEYTRRASWWEVLTLAEQKRRGGGQFKNPKRAKPHKNPDRARAIMRSFMRLG